MLLLKGALRKEHISASPDDTHAVVAGCGKSDVYWAVSPV